MIETPRLLIRPLELEDAPALASVWGDAEVMAYCGGAASEPRLVQAVLNCQACQDTHGFSPMAVIRKGDAQLIGICGFKSLPDPGGAELIYHFRKEAWGAGYATESAKALVVWAREQSSLHYLEASIDPRNTSSRHVLLKSGFVHRGEQWCEDLQMEEPLFRIELREEAP